MKLSSETSGISDWICIGATGAVASPDSGVQSGSQLAGTTPGFLPSQE